MGLFLVGYLSARNFPQQAFVPIPSVVVVRRANDPLSLAETLDMQRCYRRRSRADRLGRWQGKTGVGKAVGSDKVHVEGATQEVLMRLPRVATVIKLAITERRPHK